MSPRPPRRRDDRPMPGRDRPRPDAGGGTTRPGRPGFRGPPKPRDRNEAAGLEGSGGPRRGGHGDPDGERRGAGFGPGDRPSRPWTRPAGGRPPGGRPAASPSSGARPMGRRLTGPRPGGRSPMGDPDSGRPSRPRPMGDGPSTGPRPPSFDRPAADRPAFDVSRPVPTDRRPPAPRPFGPRSFDRRPPDPSFGGGSRRPSGTPPFRPRPEGPVRRPPYGSGPPGRPDHAPRPAAAPAPPLALGEELVAGRRPVEEAFAAGRQAIRLLVTPQRRQALERLVLHATTLRIPIVEVEGGSLTSLAGFDGHQGVALVVERAAILRASRRSSRGRSSAVSHRSSWRWTRSRIPRTSGPSSAAPRPPVSTG